MPHFIPWRISDVEVDDIIRFREKGCHFLPVALGGIYCPPGDWIAATVTQDQRGKVQVRDVDGVIHELRGDCHTIEMFVEED